jgi:hypothetical protein
MSRHSLAYEYGYDAFPDEGYADNPYEQGTPGWHDWLEGMRQAEADATDNDEIRDRQRLTKD